MTNGYNIGFEEKYNNTEVYLVPQCDYMAHHRKLGFIDDGVFKCTDSELMTLEVMEAIVSHWKTYKVK